MEDSIMQMFLEDTKEHLSDIESDLMDIEEAGANFDQELVNKVFRTAHSIKGSAGFLSLNNIRDLAHKIENVLDMVRNREMEPTSDKISIILNAFDRLEELVDNVQESDQMTIQAHVDQLTGLVANSLPQEEREMVTTTRELTLDDDLAIFTITEHELRQAQKGGNFLYILEYDLIHDVQKKGKTPLELIKSLERSGFIVDCRMELAAVGGLFDPPSNRIPFYVLYATILEPDLATSLFQIEERYIHVVDPDKKPVTTPKKSQFEGIELKKPQAATVQEVEAMEAAWDRALSMETLPKENSVVPPPVTMKPYDPSLYETPPSRRTGKANVETLEGFGLRADGDRGVLVLTGDVGVERAERLKEALLKAMERFKRIEIDLGGVEETDLSLLQLLCAAHRSGKAKGIEVLRHGQASS